MYTTKKNNLTPSVFEFGMWYWANMFLRLMIPNTHPSFVATLSCRVEYPGSKILVLEPIQIFDDRFTLHIFAFH